MNQERTMDIYERLSALAQRRDDDGIYTDANIAYEAGTTIARLRATVEDLIWALNEISIADRDGPMAKIASTAVALARAKGGDREGHR
jgi:hypothetical protein